MSFLPSWPNKFSSIFNLFNSFLSVSLHTSDNNNHLFNLNHPDSYNYDTCSLLSDPFAPPTIKEKLPLPPYNNHGQLTEFTKSLMSSTDIAISRALLSLCERELSNITPHLDCVAECLSDILYQIDMIKSQSSSNSQVALSVLQASSRFAKSVSSLLSAKIADIVTFSNTNEIILQSVCSNSRNVWDRADDILCSARTFTDLYQARKSLDAMHLLIRTQAIIFVTKIVSFLYTIDNILTQGGVVDSQLIRNRCSEFFSHVINEHEKKLVTDRRKTSQISDENENSLLTDYQEAVFALLENEGLTKESKVSSFNTNQLHSIIPSWQTSIYNESLHPTPPSSVDCPLSDELGCSDILNGDMNWSPSEIWDAEGAKQGSIRSLRLRPFSLERLSFFQNRGDCRRSTCTNSNKSIKECEVNAHQVNSFVEPSPFRERNKNITEKCSASHLIPNSTISGEKRKSILYDKDTIKVQESVLIGKFNSNEKKRFSITASIFSLTSLTKNFKKRREIMSQLSTDQSDTNRRSDNNRPRDNQNDNNRPRDNQNDNNRPRDNQNDNNRRRDSQNILFRNPLRSNSIRRFSSVPNFSKLIVDSVFKTKKRAMTINKEEISEKVTKIEGILEDNLEENCSVRRSYLDKKLGTLYPLWFNISHERESQLKNISNINSHSKVYKRSSLHTSTRYHYSNNDQEESDSDTSISTLHLDNSRNKCSYSEPDLSPPRPAFLMTTSYSGSVAESAYCDRSRSAMLSSSDDSTYERSAWSDSEDEENEERERERTSGSLKSVKSSTSRILKSNKLSSLSLRGRL